MNKTSDSICRGELRLEQPAQGYRFNVDSLILADFALGCLTDIESPRALDLGAGCGVIGLLLAKRRPGLAVTLVELQPELAELARRNIQLNALQRRIEVQEEDLRHLEPDPAAPPVLIVSNPPFYPRGSGRLNPNPQVAAARHELTCTLENLCRCAGRHLGRGGRICLVHIMERRGEVVEALGQAGLRPRAWRRILPTPTRGALRFLIMAEQGGRGELEELAPLVVHEHPGAYSDEMKRILREEGEQGRA